VGQIKQQIKQQITRQKFENCSY